MSTKLHQTAESLRAKYALEFGIPIESVQSRYEFPANNYSRVVAWAETSHGAMVFPERSRRLT